MRNIPVSRRSWYYLQVAIQEPSLFDEIDQAAEDAADVRAEADLRSGRVISHKAMKAWLLSWGTAEEAPAPEVGD